ncbi:MAG: hypothetical protein P8R54_11970 [Myxococcota bacterium]|nr:hypothetical protein [Myxococcota bacterium]
MDVGSETLTQSSETMQVTGPSPEDHLSVETGDHLTDGGAQKASSGGGGPPPAPSNPSMGGGGGPPSSSGLPTPSSGGGDGGTSPLTENREVLVGSETPTPATGAAPSPAKASGGGTLTLPTMTGKPFTASEMTIGALDTSGYTLNFRAKKAQSMHDQISKVVQTKIGYLVGIGNEIAKIHSTIDTAAAQHVAGLTECQSTLTNHIGASQAALSSESTAVAGRVKGIIDAERGAISAKAGSVRGTIRSASSSMKKAMDGAHQGAIDIMETDYSTAGESVTTGVSGYKQRIKTRLSAAEKTLAIPARNDLITCVHYRVSKTLGKSFNDNGPLFTVLAELEKQYSKQLSDAYGGNLGRLENLSSIGHDSADTAKRSGYNQLRSFEKSAQASLDETETKVLGHIDTATQEASASLDAIKQERTRSISLAKEQAATDASTLKNGTEAAMWSHAHGQGESLLAAADTVSEPLEKKPSKKTVESAITMLNMVPLDIESATAVGQRMVIQWSMGHAMVQNELDGSAGDASRKWTQDALRRVSAAEQKSTQSVKDTSEGSQHGLETTAQDIAATIGVNKRDAAKHIKEQAGTIGKNLIADADRFVLALDQNKSLDTSTLDDLSKTIKSAETTVADEFNGRANKAYAAMIDVPGVFNCTDEAKLFAALQGIGGYGAGALAWTYNQSKKRNLYSDIHSECTSEEYDICLAYLQGNDAKGSKLEISYHSNRFWGPDEDALKSLLKGLTKEELDAVKMLDGWDDVEKELYKNLEGDTLNLRVIKSLVAGNKSRAEALELINKVTDARWDEDMDALRNAIEGVPAKDRKNILAQFAVLQELAGRSGGLDVVDFTAAELDEDLLNEMNGDATDANGKPITVTNEDLTERTLSKGEQRFGDWASMDNIHDDDLYKESGPGFTDVALTSLMITAASPLTMPLNVGMAYELEKSGASNNRSLGTNGKDLIQKQAMYGSTSMEGRAAGLHYEVKEGENVEKAYKDLNYDHKDKDGKVINSAFHSGDERKNAHEPWKDKLNEIYSGMYGSSVQSDIKKADFSDKEQKLLQETRKGGQASAETMIDYAQSGAGTEEWSAYAAFEDAPQELITAYFKKHPDARKRLLSEFSGDELEKMQLLMLGKIETDKQRWEAAKIRWNYTRGSGSGSLNAVIGSAMGPTGTFLTMPGAPKVSANLFWDLLTDSGRVMDHNFQTLQKMVLDRGGESKAFDESGMLITLDGAENGTANDQLNAFRRQEDSLESAEEMYHKSQDGLTDLISTVVGIVVGAAITIFTAGAAAPVVVTLLSGLSTIVTKAALKGDRYGIEEMGLDAGILAIEVATAGLASKVTKAAKVADAKKLGNVVPVTPADFTKYELPSSVALGIKAGESFVTSSGKTLMDEKTYDKGVGDGILSAFQNGLTGIGSAYIGNASKNLSGNIMGGIEKKLDIKASWARQSLKVADSGLSKYMSGQGDLLISDVITGESNFTKKQLSLAEAAILTMGTKALSVKDDVEAGDLKEQLKTEPENADLQKQLKVVEDRIKEREPYISAGSGTVKELYKNK